jgi:hypothetical protein
MLSDGAETAGDRDASSGSAIQVFGTNREQPDEGRIFVLTKMGWFERLEGSSGAVAFAPIAQSEHEMREVVSRDSPSASLISLSGHYRKMVSEEFRQQAPSYRDSPEYSHEDPFERDSQQYHQHN